MEYLTDKYLTELFYKIATEYTIIATVAIAIISWVGYKLKIKWLQELAVWFKGKVKK